MSISIIVAKGKNNQLGINNKLPWKLKNDLENFNKITNNNVVIFGRKTFDSIGKILSNRVNVVISNNKYLSIENCFVFNNLKDAIENFKDKEIFICGGVEIYKDVIKNYKIDKLFISEVDYNGEVDVFFPEIDYSKYNLIYEKYYKKDINNEYDFIFKIYNII